MSTPFGHTLVGLAVAHRLGVRSRRATVVSIALANAPDVDIPLGVALFREPWRLHRSATHNALLVVTAGALSGALRLIETSGHPSLWRSAFTGAAIAGSHVLLDRLPFVPMSRQPWVPRPLHRRFAGMSIGNWLLDASTTTILAGCILALPPRLVGAPER